MTIGAASVLAPSTTIQGRTTTSFFLIMVMSSLRFLLRQYPTFNIEEIHIGKVRFTTIAMLEHTLETRRMIILFFKALSLNLHSASIVYGHDVQILRR